MAARKRIGFVAAPRVGSGYWLHYTAPEREDDGQGAVVGHEERIHYCATLRIAKRKAHRVMADPEVTWATITKPLFHVRRMPYRARKRARKG
jgi:hypothetical protein